MLHEDCKPKTYVELFERFEPTLVLTCDFFFNQECMVQMLWVAFDQAHTNDGQNHSGQFVGDILFERTPRCKAKAQHVFRNEALLKGVS